jgi:IS30 family transposase
MGYHHLNQEERDQLAVWRSRGMSLRVIGQRLGRSFSSLSRELRRNQSVTEYYPSLAQKKARQRAALSHRSARLKSPELRLAIEAGLRRGWSPELIRGRLKRTRPDLPSVSIESIYQWMYQERKTLVRYLACRHWHRHQYHYRRRSKIPGRISVHERPIQVQDRSEPGHWETDLLEGPRGSAAIQVTVERQTRYSRLRLVPNKRAGTSRAALTQVLERIPPSLRRSITYDNGNENSEHQTLNEDFEMRSYFCEPYHSWEKGTVENTNGLIRRHFPKRMRLDGLPDARVQSVEDWLNDRPRKVLQFQTPREAFDALCCT